MRITTKNKISILSIYLVIVTVTAYLLGHQVHDSIRGMMQQTSELIVKEVNSTLSEPLSDYFLQRSRISTEDLRKTVVGAIEQSDTLARIDVIDTKGNIVISTDNTQENKTVNIPLNLFTKDNEPHLVSEFSSLNDSGVHTVWSPVLKDGNRLGYIQINLKSKGVTEVFNRIYITLLISALAGLIALIAMDMLLHIQLERITAGLKSLLEAALHGDSVDCRQDRDEFSDVRLAAEKLGCEFKKAKNKADLTRRELDTVVNHLKVGLIITDNANHIDFINDRAKLMTSPTGQIEDYAVGLDHMMPAFTSAIGYLQNSHKLTHSVSLTVGKDGKTKNINAELYRLDNLEWHGCIILLHDQDFIKALNEDLQNATRLKSLSILLLGAIHDIKAPITAMTLNLELLNEMVSQASSPANDEEKAEHIHYLSILKSELKRLNHMISALYEQTLGENKGKTEGDIAPIVEELCLLLKAQAKSQRINLHFNNTGERAIFMGFPGQIKQALLNIILNALEALPKGGDVQIDLSVDQGFAKLLICDSGPGIPDTMKNQIFDLHFTTKVTGTGIGLYVSKQIIENHQGQITVSSEHGKGTCFEIMLPVRS